MVIKGSSRGTSAADVRQLAEHLMNATDNEQVAIVELTGTAATDLHAALAEMRAVSLGTRTRRALYHASISVPREETGLMTPARWRESADELERRLGLAGHARAVVRHRKHGREHIHVVWNRLNPFTLKCASDAHSYRTHEETSRALEERFGLRPVVGAHTRLPGTARPVARATHRCWQAAERTAIPVEQVAASIQGAWAEAADGRSFAGALKRRGLSLARGRRGLLIVVDAVGTPHSIGRRLGLRAADVRRKLADLREDDFPAAEEVAKRTKGTRAMKDRKMVNGVAPTTPTEPVDWDALLAYWRDRGFEPVQKWDAIVVDVAGALVHDYGSRLELTATAEPTGAQVEALVAACIARDWDGIRFYGSESFQRRAKAEAIRQGYPANRITLDCDAASRGPKPTAEPMPEHLSRRLGLSQNTTNTGNTEDTHDADTSPAPAPRPR